ncbi:MAG: LuxR C-terminal-related transcriptional regulator [Actinomycetota bacterium]|nr:LuxR C-terminal-related transcriptional regulator [Actinomycetota bacterium]
METVRTHARNIYRKLGAASRRELVALPLQAVPEAANARSSRRCVGGLRRRAKDSAGPAHCAANRPS